jgi:DNA-directed RNA polymerase specialized sigma24 family protein
VSEFRFSPPSGEASQLLLAWCAGDESTLGKLIPLAYEDLRRLARRRMRGERVGHSMQTTDLVDDAYRSPITVKRDWSMPKAWLYRRMSHARDT